MQPVRPSGASRLLLGAERPLTDRATESVNRDHAGGAIWPRQVRPFCGKSKHHLVMRPMIGCAHCAAMTEAACCALAGHRCAPAARRLQTERIFHRDDGGRSACDCRSARAADGCEPGRNSATNRKPIMTVQNFTIRHSHRGGAVSHAVQRYIEFWNTGATRSFVQRHHVGFPRASYHYGDDYHDTAETTYARPHYAHWRNSITLFGAGRRVGR